VGLLSRPEECFHRGFPVPQFASAGRRRGGPEQSRHAAGASRYGGRGGALAAVRERDYVGGTVHERA